jgi:hypothetical protein
MGMPIKKAAFIAACAFLAIGGGTMVAASIHHQQEWRRAFRAALDSGDRAFDNRDAGMRTYESRLQDFETAYEALRRLDPPGERDLFKAATLGKCLDDLKVYRTNQNTVDSIRGLELTAYSERLSKQISDQRQEQINDSQGLAKTAEICLIELEP